MKLKKKLIEKLWEGNSAREAWWHPKLAQDRGIPIKEETPKVWQGWEGKAKGIDRRYIINMPQFHLHHRIEPKEVQPWESDSWDIIIIHRELKKIAGLMLHILNEKSSWHVSRWVRINRSTKSEPHGVPLLRQKQRGVSITKYHGSKLMRVYINWHWSQNKSTLRF